MKVEIIDIDRSPTTRARIEMGSAKGEFTLNVTPKGSVDLPTDIEFPIDGFFSEKLPATATVEWTWTHGGAGSLAEATVPANAGHKIVSLLTGTSDGTATVTVSAVVTVPASDPSGARIVKVEPVSATFKVRKGTRTLTFECAGGVFPCDAGCAVTDYTAFIVPRIKGALSYTGTFSEFGYGPCNRTITWNAEVGDGGGCNFPVTYHPRSQWDAAPAWAVWIGFGGPLTGPGKFVATLTLPASAPGHHPRP